MRFLLVVIISGCAVTPPALDAQHPANAKAAPGRVAPAPPSLRVGVAVYPDVPAVAPAKPVHHHHQP
jgi:hypothetical protein